MRIAIFASGLYEAASGAERVAGNLATALSPAHDVYTIGFRGNSLVACRAGGDEAELAYEVTRVPHMDARNSPSAARRALWNLHDTYRPRVGDALGKLLEELRCDVLNAHSLLGASPAVWSRSIPVVQVLHDYYLLCLRGSFYKQSTGRCRTRCVECRLRRAASARLSPRVDRFVAPSAFCRDAHRDRLPLDPDRMVVIPNAAPVGGRARTRSTSEPNRLLFAGRLAKQKGLTLLHDALREVKGREWELAIAGEGPLREMVEEWQRRDPRVTYHGRLDTADLLELYDLSKWLVIPSIWYENHPMSVLEAGATGLPTIGAAIGGIPEALGHGQFGELIAPRPAAWAERLPDVLGSSVVEDHSRRLVGVDWAARYRTWVEAYEELFRAVVSSA